jgi:hypothetical protein
MTVNDLWQLCESVRKRGQGFSAVRIYKRDSDRGGLGWGPFAVGVAMVDPHTGEVTLEATEPCKECGRP